jgi:hypothetical protein
MDSVYKTYGTEQRGMRLQLGEGLHVTFSDDLPSPYFAKIKVLDAEGNADEKGEKLKKALEKTNAFQKGIVFYVPSPDELRNKALKAEQDRKVDEMRALMESGLMVLNLETKNIEQLRDLAKSIGATTVSKNDRPLAIMPLKNAICSRLGINPFKTKGYMEGDSVTNTPTEAKPKRSPRKSNKQEPKNKDA